MKSYVKRHSPLITSRIEFRLGSPPPLPSITPRIEFTSERLSYSRRRVVRKEITISGNSPKGRGNSDNFGNSSPSNNLSILEEPAQALPTLPHLLKRDKIPKPTGEPGRPGSGGHCIDTVLINSHNWSKEALEKLTVCVFDSNT